MKSYLEYIEESYKEDFESRIYNEIIKSSKILKSLEIHYGDITIKTEESDLNKVKREFNKYKSKMIKIKQEELSDSEFDVYFVLTKGYRVIDTKFYKDKL